VRAGAIASAKGAQRELTQKGKGFVHAFLATDIAANGRCVRPRTEPSLGACSFPGARPRSEVPSLQVPPLSGLLPTAAPALPGVLLGGLLPSHGAPLPCLLLVARSLCSFCALGRTCAVVGVACAARCLLPGPREQGPSSRLRWLLHRQVPHTLQLLNSCSTHPLETLLCVLSCPALPCPVLSWPVLCCTVLYCNILFFMVLYCTALSTGAVH